MTCPARQGQIAVVEGGIDDETTVRTAVGGAPDPSAAIARAGQDPKSRVPERIWREAVRVAELEGVHATSKALRFNYYDLKKGMPACAEQGGRRVGGKPAIEPVEHKQPVADAMFVQLEVPASPCAATGSGRVVVELAARSGQRMRVEASDAGQLDVAGMVQAFWSRAS